MVADSVTADAELCGCGIDVSDLRVPGLGALTSCPEGCVDGAALTSVLAALDPAQLLTDTEVLDVAIGWDRVTAWTQARGLAAVAEFARRPEQLGATDPVAARARRRPLGQVGRWSPEAEIGPALGLSPASAEMRLATACQAVVRFGAALGAMAVGRIDLVRLHALIEQTSGCSDEVAAAVTADLLQQGPLASSARFRHQVRRAVLRHDPAGASARAAQQRTDPFVRCRPGEDDIAWLQARLPAEDAQAVRTVLDAAMLAMRNRAGEDRTADQLRAAALVAPFWAALASGELVTASGPLALASAAGQSPAVTVIEHPDGTSQLRGHGWVTAPTARDVRGRELSGSWPVVRVGSAFTAQEASRARDWPVEGSYRPSAALARLVRDRDGTCRYPGCPAAATKADLDHTVSWPDGPTHPSNLAVLCRRHHRTKQAPGYGLHGRDGGELAWTLPTGHVRTTRPPPF
jgi:Domain of unknown function (DUF222)